MNLDFELHKEFKKLSKYFNFFEKFVKVKYIQIHFISLHCHVPFFATFLPR